MASVQIFYFYPLGPLPMSLPQGEIPVETGCSLIAILSGGPIQKRCPPRLSIKLEGVNEEL